MKHIFTLIFCCASLSACQLSENGNNAEESGIKPVAINNLYSMEIPPLLTKMDSLSEDASLQYGNIFSGLYIIVTDENIEEFHKAIAEAEIGIDKYSKNLEGYANACIDAINTDLEEDDEKLIKQTPLKKFSINGLPAFQTEIDTKADGIKYSYVYTLVQGKKDYYQILAWLNTEKKDKQIEKVNQMVNSFKELKK